VFNPMKKFFLTTVALGLLGLPAMAADMAPAPYYKAPPVPVPVCIWCGFYIGANAGYAWSEDNSVSSVGSLPFISAGIAPATGPAVVAGATSNIPVGKANGFIGGGQVGYNFQYSSFVYGIEADIQGLSGRSSGTTATAVGIAGFAATANTSLQATDSVRWLGTVRGRLGYTVTPSLLLYGTGGLAYGGADSSVAIGQQLTGPEATGATGPYGSAVSISSTRIGWTAGGGAEWLFSRNWTAKLEYLHYDLGSASYSGSMTNRAVGVAPVGTPLYTVATAYSTKFTGDIVRVGVNYKF
jgi:outer membrane immunogenic protein